MRSETAMIATIRRFSRFYTRVLGLLDSRLLSSEFSLSEVRVLYEIGTTKDCTAKMLIEWLNIDAGYLSRIMKKFEKAGLAYRVQSEEDGRSYLLHLSEKGRETLENMNGLSNEQVRQLIGGLSQQSRAELSSSMKIIERTLSDDQGSSDFQIRTDIRPGDIGMLIHLHGWIYAQDCGYNHVFEAYVCRTFYEWMESYDPENDRIWLAESDGRIVGSIAVIGKGEGKAQLRWFILHPQYRGVGLGKQLFEQAMAHGREQGLRQMFLETTDDQKTAIRMYEKNGFRKTAEHDNEAWGVHHVEQTYTLEYGQER
ncbi:helix-turn-helix domain-containing GNAT family N-acetyltransferase [Saccharibacillus sacchari]|uniref:Helix-turn-helix domain-containing GNAT family N-acetyltransferase n=1 Tax=Saccharibacillus sacchari TaxID=456493 RepID=A0ACC6PE24_9BACL